MPDLTPRGTPVQASAVAAEALEAPPPPPTAGALARTGARARAAAAERSGSQSAKVLMDRSSKGSRDAYDQQSLDRGEVFYGGVTPRGVPARTSVTRQGAALERQAPAPPPELFPAERSQRRPSWESGWPPRPGAAPASSWAARLEGQQEAPGMPPPP
ncbi:unnamed protein product [Prorocentrum cordatum]|uniref:Uncharacterized protein n=1 Tax=Prorocentrum cordatum TaxID=2364126 RepID=A0ABN9Y8P4_9DINO|nr:unnamed protein product [Polarella glacialis]